MKKYFAKLSGPDVCLFLAVLFLLSSCYVTKAYKYRKFELKDVRKLPYTTLAASSAPFQFASNSTSSAKLAAFLDSTLANTKTYSFLVIKNDSIIYEKYYAPVTAQQILPSFSVAKSFVSTLVGIAVDEGKIKSLNDPVTAYLPELLKRDERFGQITLQHILDMRSGIKSNENYYNPFSDVLKMGFTNNIMRTLKKLKIEQAPGVNDYKSVNTQLLAWVLERATQKNLQDYLQEKIWTPLGMESNATWNIDSKKKNKVRAFCCINATTRDFAKLGRLYLQNGNWNGRQIVSENWIKNTTDADTLHRYEGYKNQWWSMNFSEFFNDSAMAAKALKNAGENSARLKATTQQNGKTGYRLQYPHTAYHAEGILNQYVYVNPQKKLVIVRMGYYWNHPQFSPDYFLYWLGNKL
jgi:CubicO group peptidase (beta-lactamase class C family)